MNENVTVSMVTDTFPMNYDHVLFTILQAQLALSGDAFRQQRILTQNFELFLSSIKYLKACNTSKLLIHPIRIQIKSSMYTHVAAIYKGFLFLRLSYCDRRQNQSSNIMQYTLETFSFSSSFGSQELTYKNGLHISSIIGTQKSGQAKMFHSIFTTKNINDVIF